MEVYDVLHAVSLAKPFQCLTQIAKGNLRELLIGNLPKIHAALEIAIVAANDGADTVFHAIVDDVAGNLADIVLCPMITFPSQNIESMRFLLPLLVGDTLIVGFLLVPILVN